MAHSFELRTAADFHRALQLQVAEYQDDDLNSVKAVACALFAWHLAEWVLAEFFASEDLGTFRSDLVAKCPELEFMGNIADGTKHAVLSRKTPKVSGTSVHQGAYNSQAFSDGFDISSLDIQLDDGSVRSFRRCLAVVAEFWDRYFQDELGVDPEPPPELPT